MGFETATETPSLYIYATPTRPALPRGLGFDVSPDTIRRECQASDLAFITPLDFWRHVHRTDDFDECWLWSSSSKSDGHRRVRIGGRLYSPHRIAFVLGKGAIPKGMMVRHKCDNPPCCNPYHLEAGTSRDNVRDMHERGRFKAPNKGMRPSVDHVPPEVQSEIRSSGLSHLAAAARFGISQRGVRRIMGRPV